MIYIYKISNLIDNILYIGQTKNIDDRWNFHIERMKMVEDNSQKDYNGMYIHMIEHGIENFKMEIIDTCEERHRFIIEKYWIEKYGEKNTMYNLKQGSNHNENTKQRIAMRRKNSNFDYTSEEFKYKIKEATMGEKNGMYGKKGEDAINGKAVYMMDEYKNIIKTFVSVREVLKYLKLKGHVKLLEACKNGTRYKDYFWKKEW